MRRLLAVVALLVTTWPHIAVMQCVGPAPSAVSVASSIVPEHEHGGQECPVLMVCTVAMIESTARADVVEPEAPVVRTHAPRSLTPIATVLTDEPPPPRRRA